MVKEELDKLTENQRRLLNYAFEHGLSQYVELPGKRFVGVNVDSLKTISIEESVGAWSTGVVKCVPSQ